MYYTVVGPPSLPARTSNTRNTCPESIEVSYSTIAESSVIEIKASQLQNSAGSAGAGHSSNGVELTNGHTHSTDFLTPGAESESSHGDENCGDDVRNSARPIYHQPSVETDTPEIQVPKSTNIATGNNPAYGTSIDVHPQNLIVTDENIAYGFSKETSGVNTDGI